ncbi:MAG: DNA topoisomerase III [Verrucomicrobiales bacterium]
MSKILVIAEKPSVATDLARVLPKREGGEPFEQKKDYFENSRYLISSAVGHLVEQKLPTLPNGKTLPWKFETLPIIPEEFELQPIDGNKARLNLLVRLMKRKDVSELINACDAGREGELIFRYIMKLAGVDKPIRRLWMQSMTNQAILDAFGHLRSDEEMRPLADAAVCRSESDWLVGINSTRAMTAYNSKYGGFNKTPVGRVQTPTLALLVERELEIQDFVSEPYFEIYGDFDVAAGAYRGRWTNESFKKDPEKPHARPERLWDREQADAIVARCRGKTGIVEEKKKPTRQGPPMLYDLTSLQREANGRFGFSARRSLQIAQSLYERHKALTYPRTSSRYLPQDYIATSIGAMKKIEASGERTVGNLPEFAGTVVAKGWVKPNKRIFDDSKISDHFAIIPTGQIPKSLDEAEQKIYDMVTRRFVATFYPAAEFEVTTRLTRIEEDAFKTDGKILVVPGWLAVYGKKAGGESEGEEKDGKTIVPVQEGESTRNTAIEVAEKVTRPPARFNESTLLSAMETAGKRVDDEELRAAMAESGLGTPATRANIIEGLIADKYVTRDGREFIVNNRGVRLIDQLQEMKIDILASPEMTGEWEHKLNEMEHGRLPRDAFMRDIKGLTQNVVETAREYARTALEKEYPAFPVPCPACGASELGQDDGRYKCLEPECRFAISKVIASRPLSEDEARELLTRKFLGPLTGFLSRFRKPFDAAIELVEDEKGALKAGFIFEKSPEEEAEAEAIVEENFLCKCPACDKGRIFETPTSYVCDVRIKESKCKARLSKTMCQYEIPREQALKFFTEGKTDLIDKFISKKGRPFSAHLGCNTKGRRLLQWEFPPRAPKKETAAKKKAPAKKKAVKKKS